MLKNYELIRKATDLLDKFSGRKILVLGDFMMDQYIFGTVQRISPEAPVPIVDVELIENRLGGAANTVNNVISLGGQAIATGVVGNDDKGKWIINELSGKGVDVSGIFIDPKRPTTTKTRVMVGSHQIVRYDIESAKEIDPSLSEEIIHFLEGCISKVDCVAVSDYDKGVLSLDLISVLINLVQKYGKKIVVDPKIRHHLDYRNVNILKTNLKNASETLKIKINDQLSLKKAGLTLLEKIRSDVVIITQGKEGMTVFKKNLGGSIDVIYMPAFAREVFDVTGAGDSVTATLALSLSAGSSIEEAAFLSNAVAGVKVSKIGTASVTIPEVKRLLRSINPHISWEKIYAK